MTSKKNKIVIQLIFYLNNNKKDTLKSVGRKCFQRIN